MTAPSPLRGYLYVLVYAACSSLGYLAIKYVYLHYPTVNPTNAAFWGFLGATMITAPFFLFVPKLNKRLRAATQHHGQTMLAITILSALGPLLWFWALSHTSAGALGVINKSQFLFVFLLGTIFLHERLHWRELLGIACAIIGLIMLSQLHGEVSLLGFGLGLSAAFLYALQSFLIKRYIPDVDGLSLAFGRAIVVSTLFGLVLVCTNSVSVPPLIVTAIITLNALAGMIIGRMFYFSAHNHLPITKLNFIALIEIVFILLGAYLFFDESLSLLKIAGSICIAGGAAIFLLSQKPKQIVETE